ncbi:unnamed protein product [Rotaria sp. Silwood1]|nr:unnamed protein product [Rotaria sp. Silwood1]CAF1373114.1 unnamed protein product [Rotaria sp. Silwood1]CAF3517033.1 unnamed protein product [Rotaria sp. Silwood1]CAF4649249.1 unnamed protein product [Rotaria sp. Silwood1]
MGSRLSAVIDTVYNSKRREFLGRDGARWGKLGIFYFFFYLGLGAFFCTMLAVFMALTPRDRPRYHAKTSCMRTRSIPLSPGLGFRPQLDIEKNLILIDKNAFRIGLDPYVKSLNQYLRVYYWKHDNIGFNQTKTFKISNPGDCTSQNQYGYSNGKPCILVKMNKIVGFIPKPGYLSEDKHAFKSARCRSNSNAIAVHCYGEYPADADSIKNITYISENGYDNNCGSLETKWFPYEGKKERQDIYQAPYIWVQFNEVKPNVLINVMCRIFGANINFDRKSSRALTRFQIYVKNIPKSKLSGEI